MVGRPFCGLSCHAVQKSECRGIVKMMPENQEQCDGIARRLEILPEE
jgi:hypothetical protein